MADENDPAEVADGAAMAGANTTGDAASEAQEPADGEMAAPEQTAQEPDASSDQTATAEAEQPADQATPEPDDVPPADQPEAALAPEAAPETPEPEPAAEVAAEPVELVPEAPEPAPTQVSDKLPTDTPESTRNRVEIWLAETKYFFSTLEHEVGGDAGEIIAWLRARI